MQRSGAGIPDDARGFRRALSITSTIESLQIFAAALLSAGRAWL